MHNFVRSLAPRSVRSVLPTTQKRVVVLGGGPTGLLCADRLRHQFDVTVVDTKEYFEFTPSVLRAVVRPSHHADITFDYQQVLEGNLGVEFVKGEASHIDVSPASGATGAGVGTVDVKTAHGQQKLFFDYCVVSVGVSNGVWKPKTPWTAGSTDGKADQEDHDERTLDARKATLQALRERIASSRRVLVVGAGLVGVELAAEVAQFFPRVKVTLVDGAPDVLPQLDANSREYARNWLQQRHVKLNLGRPFMPDGVRDDQVVLWCVGTRSRSAGLFADPGVILRSNGQIAVNRQLQVMRRAIPTSSSVSESDPAEEKGESSVPLGNGRVFAVGDVASIDGAPTAQIIFHGEEMAACAVANIEAAEDVLPFGTGPRLFEPQQPFLCCTSLGSYDGMFSTQTELVASGTFAAVQKQIIETTKMQALQGDLVSSAIWYPVH